jgi:hypothetical protein
LAVIPRAAGDNILAALACEFTIAALQRQGRRDKAGAGYGDEI